MSIHLTPEQKKFVDEAILAGLIRGPEDVFATGMGVLIERMTAHNRALALKILAEEWVGDLHDWIHSHSRATPMLTDAGIDRDSIYGDRGL